MARTTKTIEMNSGYIVKLSAKSFMKVSDERIDN